MLKWVKLGNKIRETPQDRKKGDVNKKAKTMRKKTFFALFLLFTLMLFIVRNVSANVTIDFETFPDGTNVPSITLITDQYSSIGVIFSGLVARSLAETEPAYAAWLDGLNLEFSQPNLFCVIDGGVPHPTDTDINPAGVTMSFINPVTGGIMTTDSVSASFMDTEVGTILGTMRAYDNFGNLIAEATKITPASTFDTIAISVPGIASVYMTTDCDGAGIDTIRFAALNAIPAPGAMLLGGIGVGIVGLMRRRRVI
jgi:hypothetical protein